MRHLKLIVAAVMALAAITATTAATAYGAQAEGFLPTTNFVGEGKGGALVSAAGTEIKCSGTKILSGTMETDSHGKFDVHYTGCTAFGFPANSLGDASGVILVKTLWLLCLLVPPKELIYHLVIEPEGPLHLEIPIVSALLVVSGSAIGGITANGKSLKKTTKFAQEKGVSKPKECTGVDGKVKTATGLVELNENKKPESSALAGEATIEAEDKKTEVEIMDGI